MKSIPIYQIELNTTELCNRVCSFCPRSFDYPNQDFHMTGDTVERLIGQTKEMTNHIAIAGRGEPLLCKNIHDIIDILVYNTQQVTLVTNGYKLDRNFGWLNSLLDFSSTHKQKIKHDLDSDFKLVVNCYNGEKKELENTFGKHKGVLFTEARLDTPDNMVQLINNSSLTNRGGFLPWKQHKRRDALQKPCYVLWWKTMINYNGDVNLCCHNWSDIKSFGNIYDETFKHIWENSELRLYREQLLEWNSRRFFKECATCDACHYQKKGALIHDEYQK